MVSLERDTEVQVLHRPAFEELVGFVFRSPISQQRIFVGGASIAYQRSYQRRAYVSCAFPP